MKPRQLLPFLFLLPFASAVHAKPSDSLKGYFRFPVNTDISLAGSFGELRNNHFHTGIDIRTGGQEGVPLYAAADGYVSRINVSPKGYGTALYIDHPNGYTTVYAHMQRFNDTIAKYVRSIQYISQSFEQEIFAEKNHFRVKKGELIGYSGNSGSSGGPHLHFEIRETLTERPINPLLALDVPDSKAPVIHQVKISTYGNSSYTVTFSNGVVKKVKPGESHVFSTTRRGDNFFLAGVSKIEAAGTLQFGINTVDYNNTSYFKMGTYSIELCLNDKRRFYQEMQRLDFRYNRYLNAHVDYPEKHLKGRWIQRSYLLPNNPLPIYDRNHAHIGLVAFPPGQDNRIDYYVEDIKGNRSALHLVVQGLETPPNSDDIDTRPYIRPFGKFRWDTANFSLFVPDSAVYEPIPFSCGLAANRLGALSSVYEICHPVYPVQYDIEYHIKPDTSAWQHKDRLGIVSLQLGWLHSEVKDSFVTAKARTFGKFWVEADLAPPDVRPINIVNGRHMAAYPSIRIHISDKLSGIAQYRGTVDGQWVLFQYEPKASLLYYVFDEYCPPGKHVLELEVTDRAGNAKTLKLNFSR